MTKNIYRLLALLCVVSLLLVGAASPASATPWRDKVDPWVLQTAAGGQTEFLVYLTAQADLSAAQALPTKLEKGRYVYQALTTTAERTQGDVIATLNSLGVEYRPYWIANILWVKAGLSTIQLLAERSDVAHLYANPAVRLDAPIVDKSVDTNPNSIEWNISKVRAPDVWALGYTGQGVVIGGQDTGYQWDHPALKNKYRGWDGVSVDHNYNWIDMTYNHSPVPVDPYGHGTHTMGTMVGDDGGSNQIGMAPGAKWIGCRNMDASGIGSPETYIGCYQWFVAPTDLNGEYAEPDLAPDVINNSWGCPPSEGCTDPNVLLAVVQNLVAAGIVTAHSAGNDGYGGCSTVNTPGAIYEESFTVGATDSNDAIADFSSRGPVTVDGSNRTKPDISAPGVNIRSSVPGGGYQGGWDGTSMAGPHVAGLVALLISAEPDLRGKVDQIETRVEQSALHLTDNQCDNLGIPNNVYGWGRIDALKAVRPYGQLELDKVASAPEVTPGDLLTYTLTINHVDAISSTTNLVLTDTIPSGTTLIDASEPYTRDGDVVRWDYSSLAAVGSINAELVVSVDISTTGTIKNDDYAVHSDQIVQVRGVPVSTPVGVLDILELNKVASASSVFPGDFITYTLTVINNHPTITATNVVLTDTLPLNTSFVSATWPYTLTDNGVRWDIPNLVAQGIRSIELVVQVDSSASGNITNSDYAVKSDYVVPVRGQPVVTQLETSAFLEITKSASVSLTFPGSLITYTLTITNNHPSLTTTNLVLTDTLPVGTSFVSSPTPGHVEGDIVRWDIPSLAPQSAQNILLVVKVEMSARELIENADYGVYSDQAAFVAGSPVNTPVGLQLFVPITVKSP